MFCENFLKQVSNWYLVMPFFAMMFPYIMNSCGFVTGAAAIEYYGEVHQDDRNKLIHMVMLPFAGFGYSLGIPALFQLNYDNAALSRNLLYIFYIIHYASIDIVVTFWFAVIYFIPLYLSHIYYRPCWQIAVKGITAGSVLLLTMELIGHSVFEIQNSRPEGVINAIVYSHYFISDEWIKLLR